MEYRLLISLKSEEFISLTKVKSNFLSEKVFLILSDLLSYSLGREVPQEKKLCPRLYPPDFYTYSRQKMQQKRSSERD